MGAGVDNYETDSTVPRQIAETPGTHHPPSKWQDNRTDERKCLSNPSSTARLDVVGGGLRYEMAVVLYSKLCPVMSRKIRGFDPVMGGPDLYMVLFRYLGDDFQV